MLTRQPYTGPFRKLVLAFDVGTTFSGISYCILDPGEVPVIRGVNRYPAQERVGGDSKIPTIVYCTISIDSAVTGHGPTGFGRNPLAVHVTGEFTRGPSYPMMKKLLKRLCYAELIEMVQYYNPSGNVQAVGAEAIREGIVEEAEDKGWSKAEWFKLHLHPKTTSAAFLTNKIPPLPDGKSVVDVFSDFLRYLYQCARNYIEESHSNGIGLWSSLETRTEFVLAHPNGWEGGEQALMRSAAIRAGLIPDTDDGRSRLSFVTEGEASLHFCIQNGFITKLLDGQGILIVDAGGGTIDVSAYKKTSLNCESYEEIAPPQCAFKGSIFVTRNAAEYLEILLSGSKFADDVRIITERFDQTTKLRFVNPDEVQFIQFGGLRDRAPELNIKSGQLKLLGSDVAEFFAPSIATIIKMVEHQCKRATAEISSIFLVGGFAANNWVFNNLKTTLASNGLDVCRPDNHTNKAVADGAVSYYIDHFVTNRVAKYSYGTDADLPYDPSDTEHTSRPRSIYTDLTGRKKIRGSFDVVLPKNTRVSETEEFRRTYHIKSLRPSNLNTISQGIMCFKGCREDPRWLDEEKQLYSTLCYIEGDLSQVPKPRQYSGHLRDFYHTVQFDVILSLGLTEFKAFIAWTENGKEKRSPAQMVYDPDTLIVDSTSEV